jgi:hypothetical protein
VHNVSDVRQIEVHTTESLVPGPSHLEDEIAFAKLKKYKLRGDDEIPAEMTQAGGEILLSEIHKLINSVWIKEELPDQWKESIVVPVHKKVTKLNVIFIFGISLLSASYKILSNILLSKLNPYIEKIIWDHQCGFRRNRSTKITRIMFFLNRERNSRSTVITDLDT